MQIAWVENLLTRRTLGLVTEVHHGPGVYHGPGGGVPWPSRGVSWPLYEEYGLQLSYYLYSPLVDGVVHNKQTMTHLLRH